MPTRNRPQFDAELHPLADLFPPIPPDEYLALVEDVRLHGVREPVVLTTEHTPRLLDGKHRRLAAIETGRQLPFRYASNDDPVVEVIGLNVRRRHLTESQRALIAASLETQKRQGRPKEGEKDTNWYLSREDAASALNVGTASVARAAAVVKAETSRDGVPVLQQAIRDGSLTVGDAHSVKDEAPDVIAEAVKRTRDGDARTATSAVRIIQSERLKAGPTPPLPQGQYRVVVADPPWDIEFDGGRLGTRLQEAQAPPYPTMTVDEIKALPVEGMLADDAWVFLWTIQQQVRESFEILDGWGAPFRFMMVWVKADGENTYGMQAAGMPRANHEVVLVGKRGSAKFVDTKEFPMAFTAAHPGGHSSKPDRFYDTLRRVTIGPRVDMFSRRAIDGFDGWGNQADDAGS